LNLRPLDPQFPAACSPPFANDRILSATNDLDTDEHSRTPAKSAVLLHGLLHDLSTGASSLRYLPAKRKSQSAGSLNISP